MKFGEIARLLSAEYSALSDNHKALWKKASDNNRLRFKREIQDYTPPPPMDHSNAVVGISTTQVVTSGESAKYASGDSYDDDSMVDEVRAPEEKKAKKGTKEDFSGLLIARGISSQALKSRH